MEKDCCAVMVSVSKATGHLLDGLYLAVQPFTDGIRDPMFAVGQDIGKIAFQGLPAFSKWVSFRLP